MASLKSMAVVTGPGEGGSRPGEGSFTAGGCGGALAHVRETW